MKIVSKLTEDINELVDYIEMLCEDIRTEIDNDEWDKDEVKHLTSVLVRVKEILENRGG